MTPGISAGLDHQAAETLDQLGNLRQGQLSPADAGSTRRMHRDQGRPSVDADEVRDHHPARASVADPVRRTAMMAGHLRHERWD